MMTTLEDYLGQLDRELQALPEASAEVLREVRSHLELAIRDMGRNGKDEATCLALALDRFGTAEHIGGGLRRVHGRATWQEIGMAALPLLLFGWLPTVLEMPVWISPLLLAAATLLGHLQEMPVAITARLAEAAVAGLSHPMTDGRSVQVTCSAGLALHPRDGRSGRCTCCTAMSTI